MEDAILADKEAFSIFSEGKSISPLRTNFSSENEEGSMLFMPGYVPKAKTAGLKLVSVFPNNKELPVTPGTIVLVDDENGMVNCIMEGTYVTAMRTGAATGAAIDVLAKKDSKVATLIGTGGQAKMQLEAILTGCKSVETVYVYSRTKEKREAFVEAVQREGVEIVAVDDVDKATEVSDIVVLATTAKEAVINGDRIKAGTLISGVGSYMPSMHEIDSKSLQKASKIYFDSKEAVLSEAGCLITPLAEGEIDDSDLTGELGEVINGTVVGRENDEEIIVFKSVGISTQDIVTGKAIFEKARTEKVGLEIEL